MITIISGSNRKGNNTIKVARQTEKILSSKNIKCEVIDLEQLPRDLFVPEHYGDNVPDEFKKYQEMILKTDGLLTIVPEYNGSFPGVLKYFVDLLKFPESLVGIPCAFIGVAAGQFGAMRAIEQLEMVYQYREAHIFGKRVFIPGIYNKLDENNEVTDEYLVKKMNSLLTDFDQFCKQLKN